MSEPLAISEQNVAALAMRNDILSAFEVKGTYEVECYDADGNLKWRDGFTNLITTVGKNEILGKFFGGSSYTAAHYVGLKGSGTPVAGDTMSSHATWSDIAPYSNATRPAYTDGTPSAGSVDNSAAKAVFNINATATVAGCFLTTNDTVSGTTGILISVGDFAASRSVINGDTLSVQITYSIS